SPERLKMTTALEEAFPQTQLGGATWGWLKSSVNATRRLMEPKELDKLKGVELHVLRATGDQIVQTDTEDAFARYTGADERGYDARDSNGRAVGSQHELLFDSDDVRNPVLRDVRQLLTGG